MKLCKECIEFLEIEFPENSYSVYDLGLCQFCHQKTKTTNPEFFLREHRSIKNSASNAQLEREEVCP